MRAWILPGLLVVVWALSWFAGTRRFRLWFALLAPAACVGGIVLAAADYVMEPADVRPPSGSGSAVQHWASSVDSGTVVGAWLFAACLPGLGVAVALSVVTLIVEYVLLVRRDRNQ